MAHFQFDRGLSQGVKGEDDIRLVGDYEDLRHLDILNELAEYSGKYPYEICPELPDDVNIIKGRERACPEGCYGNAVGILQGLALDHQGKGGWSLILGKGFDLAVINAAPAPVLIVGPCAVEKTSEQLLNRLGKGKVYLSRECNDISAVIESMVHLMRINPFNYARSSDLNPIKGLKLIIQAKLKGSRSRQVNPACSLIKLR